jgi:hypothetical protein
MVDGMKGGAKLPLSDGRVLTLEYDFDGLIALEEASGMKMPEFYKEMRRLEREKENPSLRLQRAIFYGGLQAHHPEITLQEVGKLLLTEGAALEAAHKALNGAHGPKEEAGEESEPDPTPQGAGIGDGSSKAGPQPASTEALSASKPRTPTPAH